MASPLARAASSARVKSSSLSALATAPGSRSARAGCPTRGPKGHGAHAATALSGRSGCRPSGCEQAGLAEVRGVGEPGGLAVDHPDTRTPRAPRGQFFDSAVVEGAPRGRRVLGEDFGHLPALLEGRAEHSLEDVGRDN